MIYHKSGSFHVWRYDSTSEQFEAAHASRNRHLGVRGAWNQEFGRPDFHGRDISGWKHLGQIVSEPWQDGMTVFERMMQTLGQATLAPPKSTRRRQCYSDDSGDEVDLDRLQRGQPFWRTTRRECRTGQQTVTIITDVSAPWTVPHSQILWRGAAAVCLAQLLEAAGYRVELWAVHLAEESFLDHDKSIVATCLKRSSDLLDTSSLINAVSAWYYRTVFFSCLNVREDSAGTDFAGLHREEKISDHKHEITSDEKTVVCERVWSESAAITWVRDQLKRFE